MCSKENSVYLVQTRSVKNTAIDQWNKWFKYTAIDQWNKWFKYTAIDQWNTWFKYTAIDQWNKWFKYTAIDQWNKWLLVFYRQDRRKWGCHSIAMLIVLLPFCTFRCNFNFCQLNIKTTQRTRIFNQQPIKSDSAKMETSII